jgi:MoaA/NifB/PqqE/SkfB family radical SAM enzyme
MEESLYRKILGEFAQAGGGKLSLTVSVGDPLMDPALIERIRYARSIPAITSIGTISNCLNLHAFDTDALLTSGLTTMTISTCGFNEERYHRLYRSAVPYARMKENILHLLRRNSALGKPVAIEVGLRIDEPEKKVLKEEGFDEVVRLAAHTNTLLLYDSWRNHVTQKDLTGTMRLRPHVPRAIRASAPCAYPFAPELTVLCNGAVTLCGCHELNGDSDLVIGNSMHQTLQEIYASPKLRGILEKWYYRRRLPRQCYFCNQYHPARFTR